MKTLRLYLYFLIFIFQALAAEELKPDLTVMIPMRDGTKLPTDLYLPSLEARGLPCILLRSPAGRDSHFKDFAKLAKEGYVVAIQETRSALDAEGKTLPFISDGWGKLQDGYDTVEWLAHSPYTNGKIGTWGASALGITQLLMAPTNPPHLKCQYILVAAASLYHHGLFPGGQLLKNQAEGWLGLYARDSGVQSYVCQRPFYNEFWKQLNTLELPHRVQVPGMHIGGWYDTFLQGTLTAFTSRQYKGGEGAKGQQKLVIGPWTHFWPLSQHFGDFEMPKAGMQPPVDISPKHWFDYYLKDIANGLEEMPAVTYYVMGPFDGTPSSGNVWRTSDVWPVPATEISYYLTPEFQLKTKPAAEGKASYQYDPMEVIPTLGGRNLFLESGPKDQRSIENRKDILIFTSDKLQEDLEVTGPISATLFFKTDQKDTDVVLRLCDVYPDGKSVLISEGGYRLGLHCYQTDLNPSAQTDKIYEVKIDLWATSMVFAKGHAIRLSVSSSNYPRLEKNLNVGFLGSNMGKSALAHNILYMGEKYPSHIVLPIVKTTEGEIQNSKINIVQQE
jgi:predicted acyl esterase